MGTYEKLELPSATPTILIKNLSDFQSLSLTKPRIDYMRLERSKLAN